MPTYDYQCENCGTFELLQSMKDEPLEICPKCGGKASRLFSTNVNFLFKGSGFYITDYTRNDEYKKKAAEEGKAPVPKPDKESAGSSSSPAPKSTLPAPTTPSAAPASPAPAAPSTGSQPGGASGASSSGKTQV